MKDTFTRSYLQIEDILRNLVVLFLSLRAKIGANKRSQKESIQEIDVAKMIKHEMYEPMPEFKNDIGLLKLEKKYQNNG